MADHCATEQRERNRAEPGLRVLVIDEEPPYPLDAGKRIRTWNLMRELAQRHRITYLSYAGQDSAAIGALKDAQIQVEAVPPRRMETGPWLYAGLLGNLFSRRPFSVSKHDRRRFHQAFRKLLTVETYDLIHCEWTPYAHFALTPQLALKLNAGSRQTRVPVLIATHNIEADILDRRAEQQSSFLGRRYFQMQARRMERFERWAFAHADCVTAVSNQDRRRAQEWGAVTTGLVANGVATDFHQPSGRNAGQSRELLFLGSLDWFPNVDAIRYFLGEIFPLIRERDSRVGLSIVGRRPDAGLRHLVEANPGATLVGEVEDVRPYLERAAAVVVPLRIGGGTRIKILEAMAAGKVVVSTTIGAEGLDVEHGVHLLLADLPVEFADCVLHALDPDQLRSMPAQARARIEQRYSWRLQAEELEACWLRTVAGARKQ